MNKYFTILFLSETASLSDVKKAYRKLAKKYHPDKNSGSEEFSEKFRNIQEAYEKITEYFKSKKQNTEKTKETYNQSSKTNSTNNKSNNNSKKTENQKAENWKVEKDELEEEFEEEFEKNNKVVLNYSIGENIEIGYFEYNVLKFEYLKTVGNQIFKAEADGIYLMIELKIINKTNIQRNLHNYMFRLSNVNNDYFEYSTKGLSTIAMSGIKCIEIFGKDFNPKIPSTVNLIFEVPEIDVYFLNLCGGEYTWDENSICHCKEIKVVKII